MKNKGPKNNHKRLDSAAQYPLYTASGVNPAGRSTIRRIRQRYCTSALILATLCGAGLMLFGYPALGKGLILGALFSILNFILIAAVLPMRLGQGRGKSIFFSMGSIYLRYAVMAVPLVLALKQEAFAVSTAAIGLFMVQLAILGDQLLVRWRHSFESE
jgi:hypothetical protein